MAPERVKLRCVGGRGVLIRAPGTLAGIIPARTL
jgi:hypothetical protein